ncbi:MAG: hypothetical protein IJ899_13355 [Blautia sp.]|nr:hypothetical protein [Blautia sp.]
MAATCRWSAGDRLKEKISGHPLKPDHPRKYRVSGIMRDSVDKETIAILSV